MTANKLETFMLPLTIAGTDVEISGMFREGTGVPLVFLHGFGSTKEDYADVIQQADRQPRAPGPRGLPPGRPGPRVDVPLLLQQPLRRESAP